ncbi:flagellin N-terminal helical domain-containing protein [Parvularcula lutaonensis]|uniref:Flagellin n=1 Tax=Parvularcula lutaonensis TaxID=491923 RepID=A0ABV7MFG5_9PROT|nr:flagellin [Parvularcula lutaonensis]GGY53426.1 hypothetical protein GCM10007148_23340 [Parvularcula lutaonensis]
MLLTNASAMTAMRTLRLAESNLDTTQNRISTGFKVSKAGDNPAFFLVSNTVRGDITAYEGQRDTLLYALGAIQTAQAAQSEIDNAILNIKSAVVALETGSGEKELERVILEQVDQVRKIISGTSFNGINLLERDNVETFLLGYEREGRSLDFDTLSIRAQGLALRTAPVSATINPLPGAALDLNSQNTFGTPGAYTPQSLGSISGVNVGLGGSGVSQRTFAISFETGADITTEQIIYEEGGGIRGLNISIRNGQLVFGGYNIPNDGTTPWGYREAQATVQANTRYTAQLVLDGNASATGEFRAYLDGTLVDTATGVGVLYNHGNAIGLGRIAGNAVVNGVVKNDTGAGPTGNRFQGANDKVVLYNQIFTPAEFDQMTSYLAEGWLPPKGIAFYIGSQARQDSATLVELLEAVAPVDQPGFSTAAALEVLDAAQEKANRAFAQLGFYEDRITGQRDYLMGLTDSLEEGVAALVEADLQEESARLQSFQVQTTLARQSLQISNSRSNILLTLFN